MSAQPSVCEPSGWGCSCSAASLVAQYYFSVAGTSLLPKSSPTRSRPSSRRGVSLATAADVSEAGVDIGRVTELGEHGSATVLELELDDEHAPDLPRRDAC